VKRGWIGRAEKGRESKHIPPRQAALFPFPRLDKPAPTKAMPGGGRGICYAPRGLWRLNRANHLGMTMVASLQQAQELGRARMGM